MLYYISWYTYHYLRQNLHTFHTTLYYWHIKMISNKWPWSFFRQKGLHVFYLFIHFNWVLCIMRISWGCLTFVWNSDFYSTWNCISSRFSCKKKKRTLSQDFTVWLFSKISKWTSLYKKTVDVTYILKLFLSHKYLNVLLKYWLYCNFGKF